MKLFIALAIVSTIFFQSSCFAGPDFNRVCSNNFCINDHINIEKNVVSKFGKGYVYHLFDDPSNSITRCYYDSKTEFWTEFTFTRNNSESIYKFALINIFQSKEPLCSKNLAKSKTEIIPTTWDISLGDSKEQVLNVLGTPQRVDDTSKKGYEGTPTQSRHVRTYGEYVYVYDTEESLSSIFIYFKNDKVNAIWASYIE